jgi:hypothetical protein
VEMTSARREERGEYSKQLIKKHFIGEMGR